MDKAAIEDKIVMACLMLQKGNIDSVKNRRSMINIFGRAICLYDDRFTMVLNGSGRPRKLAVGDRQL